MVVVVVVVMVVIVVVMVVVVVVVVLAVLVVLVVLVVLRGWRASGTCMAGGGWRWLAHGFRTALVEMCVCLLYTSDAADE